MTSNATYSRTVTVDLPDFASKAVSFSLLTSVAIDAANNEVFPRKEYSLTLDGSGTGSIALPCPDNSGTAAWAWRVSLPDGRDVTTTLAYAGTSLDLSDWLTAATTSETADAITALIESKADKVSGATADNLAGLDANGNLQDSGFGVIDEDSMATDSATDVPTQQSVKAYVDAQIGTVDDVTELTTTTGDSTNMLRVAAAGGLEYRTTAQVLSDIGAETAGAAATVQGNLDSHTGNTSNPHSVTAAQVDAPTTGDFTGHTGNTSNPHSVTAAQVGAYTTGQTDSAIDTDIGTHASLTTTHGVTGAIVGTSDSQALTNKTIIGTTNDVDADRVFIVVRNSSGGVLSKGTPVYISGYNVGLDLIEVDAADASASATMPAVGLMADDLANNATGTAIMTGNLDSVDTSAYSAGDRLYVSETAGELTATRPTGTALAQSVGEVLRSHATSGVIEVERSQTFKTGLASVLLLDGTAADMRTTLGLGSAAVEDTSAFDAAGAAAAAQAASQPVDADLTAIAGLSSADSNFIVGSATGWVAESGATVRTSLGLGSAAVEDASAFDAAGSAAAAQAASQPVDADLTAIAGLSSADGNFIVGSATGWVAESGATALASIGAAAASHTHAASDVTSGTLVHERGGLEADVSAYAGLVKISGGSTSAVTVTAFGESLIDDNDASTARTTLGLGTMATEATGSYLAATGATTGATSQAQTFTNGVVTGAIKPASDSTTALQLQNSSGTAVVTVDTSNSLVGINKTPSSTTLDVTRTTSAADQTGMKSVIVASGTGYHSSLNFQCQIYNVAASASYGMSGFASINSTSATTSAVYLYGGQFQVAAGTSGGYNTSATIAAAINVARPFHGTVGGTNSFSESYGVRIENVGSTNVNSSTITTAAGVRIADQSGATNTYAIYTGTGHVRFGDRLTVIQDSATAAVPVLTLQQDDDSEDMIEFTGTVGTGNAIEAVGAKTLTTTHFIKCTITGVGNVYIPVGTIA